MVTGNFRSYWISENVEDYSLWFSKKDERRIERLEAPNLCYVSMFSPRIHNH